MANKTRERTAVTRHLGRAAALALLMVMAACALSPQTVAIRPTITTAPADIGHDRSVALTVVDQRGSKVFGSLGGIYSDTATIGPSGDITEPVRKAVTEALSTQGFKVVAAGSPADLDMQIRIEDISYQASGDPMVRKIAIGARVGVDAKRGSQTYSASSQVKESREVLKAPNPAENEAYLNATVSHALEKLLADSDLIKFIS